MKDPEDTSAAAEPGSKHASPAREDESAADADVPQIVADDQDAREAATELTPVIAIERADKGALGGQKDPESDSVDINSLDDLPDGTVSPARSVHSDANLTPSIIVSFPVCIGSLNPTNICCARVLVYRLLGAAYSPLWPLGRSSIARPPPSAPSTAASSPEYPPLPARLAYERHRLAFDQAIVAMFPSAQMSNSTKQTARRRPRRGRWCDGLAL